MSTKTINISLAENFLEDVTNSIKDEIEKTSKKIKKTVLEEDFGNLLNLSLDQFVFYVNSLQQKRNKRRWMLTQNTLPITITNKLSSDGFRLEFPEDFLYSKIKNKWFIVSKDNTLNNSLTFEEFQKVFTKELLNSARTAAYYAVLSFYNDKGIK